MRHSSVWECARWALFCRRITNPEIGALFTFLTFRRKVLHFSCDIVSRKNISLFFFFKETLLIIGQGSQNVCLRESVRRSENYFHTPGYRFVSVQMEKKKPPPKANRKETIQTIPTYFYLKLWCSSRFGDEETPWFIVPIIYGLGKKKENVYALKVKDINTLKLSQKIIWINMYSSILTLCCKRVIL